MVFFTNPLFSTILSFLYHVKFVDLLYFLYTCKIQCLPFIIYIHENCRAFNIHLFSCISPCNTMSLLIVFMYCYCYYFTSQIKAWWYNLTNDIFNPHFSSIGHVKAQHFEGEWTSSDVLLDQVVWLPSIKTDRGVRIEGPIGTWTESTVWR